MENEFISLLVLSESTKICYFRTVFTVVNDGLREPYLLLTEAYHLGDKRTKWLVYIDFVRVAFGSNLPA